MLECICLFSLTWGQVIEAAEQEWNLFHEERTAGIDEISRTRQRVAEEDAARRNELNMNKDEMETDLPSQNDDAPTSAVAEDTGRSIVPPDSDSVTKVTDMDVDDAAGQTRANESGKEELTSLQADDDDAVEYQLPCQGSPSSFYHQVFKLIGVLHIQNVIAIFFRVRFFPLILSESHFVLCWDVCMSSILSEYRHQLYQPVLGYESWGYIFLLTTLDEYLDSNNFNSVLCLTNTVLLSG